MLVLTRKPDQSILMKGSGLITLKLIRINGNQARLGFEAPTDFKIYREELLNAQELYEFQLKKGDDHHPCQINQRLRRVDDSLMKVCS